MRGRGGRLRGSGRKGDYTEKSAFSGKITASSIPRGHFAPMQGSEAKPSGSGMSHAFMMLCFATFILKSSFVAGGRGSRRSFLFFFPYFCPLSLTSEKQANPKFNTLVVHVALHKALSYIPLNQLGENYDCI